MIRRHGQCRLAQDLSCSRPSLSHALCIQVHNRACRATLNRFRACQVIAAVVDPGQIVFYLDQLRCVRSAAATGGAGNFAIRFGALTLRLTLACHPEAMAYGVDGEKIFRADLDTCITGRASLLVDNRQTLW